MRDRERDWERGRDWETERWQRHAHYRTVESGAERNREHDEKLARDVRVWVEEIELAGGRVEVQNGNDLLREFGKLVNVPLSLEEKTRAAAQLDLEVVDGKVQFPDARLLIIWRDGRREVRDLDRTTEHYRPRTLAAKSKSGFWLTGGQRAWNGRRAPGGPDVVSALARTTS